MPDILYKVLDYYVFNKQKASKCCVVLSICSNFAPSNNQSDIYLN